MFMKLLLRGLTHAPVGALRDGGFLEPAGDGVLLEPAGDGALLKPAGDGVLLEPAGDGALNQRLASHLLEVKSGSHRAGLYRFVRRSRRNSRQIFVFNTRLGRRCHEVKRDH